MRERIVVWVALLATVTGVEAATITSYVDLVTQLGSITVGLYENDAPVTTKNFLAYVKESKYNGTIIHRLQANFVFQGGAADVYGQPISTFPPIVNEAGKTRLSNVAGTIAMARAADANSATSQFFFNLVDNASQLDYGSANAPEGYAVFGRVVSGQSVIGGISAQIPFNANVLPFPVTPQGEMVRVLGVFPVTLEEGTLPKLRILIDGSGTVRPQPGKPCSSSLCSLVMKSGQTVKLTAVAGKDSYFVGWSGDCVGGDKLTQITLPKEEVVSKTCVARFAKRT